MNEIERNMTVLYSVNKGNIVYEIYQSEGSSKFNVRTRNLKSGKTKFIHRYATYPEARFYVDTNAQSRRLV